MRPAATDIRSLVTIARRRYRPGVSTVYDHLLRTWGALPAQALVTQLRDKCGIEVLDGQGAFADFTGMSLEVSRSLRCVIVRRDRSSAGEAWLACEDPWDDSLLHVVSAWVGHDLTPAAVTYADLIRWLSMAAAGSRTL